MIEQVPDPPPKSKLHSPGKYDSDIQSMPETPWPPLLTVWYGIVFAAMCFPSVLVLIVTVCSTIVHGYDGSFLLSLGPVAVFVMASILFGLVWGSVMSLPAYLITQMLSWILKGILSVRGAIGVFGGLTGFLCTTSGGLFLPNDLPPVDFWIVWSLLSLVSLLAIVMGHLGAIWACYRNRNPSIDFYEPILSLEKQITIGFLMKLTVAVAVLVVILKAAGTAGLNIGIAWGFYIVVQACLLFCDHLITRWLSRRSAIQAATQN